MADPVASKPLSCLGGYRGGQGQQEEQWYSLHLPRFYAGTISTDASPFEIGLTEFLCLHNQPGLLTITDIGGRALNLSKTLKEAKPSITSEQIGFCIGISRCPRDCAQAGNARALSRALLRRAESSALE